MALMGQILTVVRLVFGVFLTRKEEFSGIFRFHCCPPLHALHAPVQYSSAFVHCMWLEILLLRPLWHSGLKNGGQRTDMAPTKQLISADFQRYVYPQHIPGFPLDIGRNIDICGASQSSNEAKFFLNFLGIQAKQTSQIFRANTV